MSNDYFDGNLSGLSGKGAVMSNIGSMVGSLFKSKVTETVKAATDWWNNVPNIELAEALGLLAQLSGKAADMTFIQVASTKDEWFELRIKTMLELVIKYGYDSSATYNTMTLSQRSHAIGSVKKYARNVNVPQLYAELGDTCGKPSPELVRVALATVKQARWVTRPSFRAIEGRLNEEVLGTKLHKVAAIYGYVHHVECLLKRATPDILTDDYNERLLGISEDRLRNLSKAILAGKSQDDLSRAMNFGGALDDIFSDIIVK